MYLVQAHIGSGLGQHGTPMLAEVDTLTTTDVDDDVFVCCKSQVMTLRSPLNSLWREIQNYFDHCQVNGLVKNRKEASQTDRDHKQLKVEK